MRSRRDRERPRDTEDGVINKTAEERGKTWRHNSTTLAMYKKDWTPTSNGKVIGIRLYTLLGKFYSGQQSWKLRN